MRVLKTHESRFNELKDYPFQSHYVDVNKIRLHYLDEGPCEARPVLLLHGVPAWSYLYRHIIRRISDAGLRVIVPDLIGFGKSDKLYYRKDHTYESHIRWITNFIELLDLKNIILFGHDWGSLIGLRIAARYPELFSGIIISNGMLPTGEQAFHITFKIWKLIARYSPFLPVDLIIKSGVTRKMDKQEKRAYRAPFPSSKFKAGIRALPGLVPGSPDDTEAKANRTAWESLGKWDKHFLTLFSISDPITRGGDEYLQKRIPGACGQNHKRLEAQHFIPEDRSTELADNILKFIEKADN